MAEKTINLTDTKERVALELVEKIIPIERTAGKQIDRKMILDLYAECLDATSGYRKTQ